MKRLILFTFTFAALGLSAQTIINNDFENWTSHYDPSGTVVVDSLVGGMWESGNPLLITLPSLLPGMPKGFMYDTTYAYSGSKAVALRTGFLNSLVATGNLFTGIIDGSIAGIAEVLATYNPLAPATTGFPSTDIPAKLKGYYFYQPGTDYIQFDTVSQVNDSLFGTADTCKIAVIVHKWNSSLGKRDTVGYGEFKSNDTTLTGFVPFEIIVNYPNQASGDSISIVMLSSAMGTSFGGAPGSLLIVDSIYFEGNYLSMNSLEKESVKMYSFNDEIYIETLDLGTKLIVHDLLGRELFNTSLEKGLNKHQINYSGVVIATIVKNNSILKTKKLIINKQ